MAQESLTISQPAYVTIGTKDGVVARFIPSQDPKQNTELVLYFQNSGDLLRNFPGARCQLASLRVQAGRNLLALHITTHGDIW